MSYRLDWRTVAEDELAEVWLASADRPGVTAAVAQLERDLARSPLSIGESRRSTLHRVAFRPPVGFEYEVIPDDAVVIIHGVFAA